MNIFELPRAPLQEELATVVAESGNVRVERVISTGQVSGWYDQPETEIVVLLEGGADIEYADGGTVTLSKGDTLLIEPHVRHRVSFTSAEPPCVWLCIFIGRENGA
jgi:cupin 2 domain-containing protein